MSLLKKAQSGAKISTQVYVVYGPEGTGKSTFASQFPNPIFLDIENGSNHLNVTRLTTADISDYTTLVKTLNELLTESHDYKTVVIDSLTALEAMLTEHICKQAGKSSISDFAFGAGHQLITDETTKMMNLLRKLQTKGMDVVIVGHTKVKNHNDPYDNTQYDRYILQCDQRIAEKVKAFADNVFFARYEVSVLKDDKTKKTKAYSTGNRIMFTEWRAGADAKNRLSLPYEMPLDYKALVTSIENLKPKSADELKQDISALLMKADPKVKETGTVKLTEAGDDVFQLMRVKTKLTSMVSVQ